MLARDNSTLSNRPYIASSLLGCWLTDPLNHFFGRRGTLFWCGIFCTFSVIGQGFAQTWPQLFVRPPLLYVYVLDKLTSVQVCRLLLGLGMGPKATTSPVFAAENTPASIRGGLVMSWQLWVMIFFTVVRIAIVLKFRILDCIWYHAWIFCQSCSPRDW